MKIHLQKYAEVAPGYSEIAKKSWENENLIPDLERKCDGLMMKKGNEKFFTDNMDEVTCKKCIKGWNKYVRESNK